MIRRALEMTVMLIILLIILSALLEMILEYIRPFVPYITWVIIIALGLAIVIFIGRIIYNRQRQF